MSLEEWGVICMHCGQFIPEPEDSTIRIAKQEHLEEEHGIIWHEAIKNPETGEVEKV